MLRTLVSHRFPRHLTTTTAPRIPSSLRLKSTKPTPIDINPTPEAVERSMREFNAQLKGKLPVTAEQHGKNEKANESAAGERAAMGDMDPEQINPKGNQTLKGASFKAK
ncbi:hypothetical protein PhCBS80983_g01233 [Powellomyces hirtus]|uniref:Uncharacterized protein n=1 Tax=Powellomyces hirtus TaxID=109895 RepID=A0A507EBK5_9FUNG|nr:hypothetical protein PhCBS80983_g01233 [Powellomyces hirtus]